ncbi:toprim domain-containing protein [Spirillospora sp. NPDC047279]|uniref:toprim domain-containing protein n=1 Tax=Spirillospora sp. NPDC047279 TaxID=3155478 RepID=UPI0033E9701D
MLGALADDQIAQLHGEVLPWPWLLDQLHRHGRFGFENCLLIGAQRDSATDVRSYDEWRAEGRQVVRGETGIRIVSSRGNPRSVFDVEQTAGPSYEQRASRVVPGAAVSRLGQVASELGLYADRGSTWAYGGREDRRILVPRGLDDLAAAVFIAHQLSHILQRGDRMDDGVDQSACVGVRRVRADSVSYLVLAHLGLDASPMVFPAVKSWAGDDPRSRPSANIRAVGEQIRRVATRIRRELEAAPHAEAAPGLHRDSSQQAAAVSVDPDADTNRLLAMQEEAHAFFRGQLGVSWGSQYLADRGFSTEVQEQWQLGFAPGGRAALTDHLRDLGRDDELIVAAGLARRGRDGLLYDTFRDRVIVPIKNAAGAVVGFTGRRQDQGKGPKYLNSRDSRIFHKKELLLGLAEGRTMLSRGARPIVVEGPFDLLAVATSAPEGLVPVAPCGTAFGPAQLNALRAVVDVDKLGLVLALDADPAGRSGVLRTWRTVSQVEGPVDVAVLPKGTDPADLMHYEGCMTVREALRDVVPLADLVVDVCIERFGGTFEFAEQRLAAVRAAASLISEMPPAKIARQVSRVSARTGLPPAQVTSAVASAVSPEPPPSDRAAPVVPPQLPQVPELSVNEPQIRDGRRPSPSSRGAGRHP